jgi:hypothetical protein
LDDGAGGTYPDPAGPQQIGPVLGLFWALRGEERIASSQLGQHGSYRWAVPHTTDIRITDQVVLLGTLYNVVWVPPVAYHDADLTVGLEEAGGAAPVLAALGAGYSSPLWILGIGST